MRTSHRHSLTELAGQRWDLLVLGGGINGAAVARDAAMRGLRVLLLEKRDFGFGASSRSTKLAHGGLRYLETCQFSLVRESLKERDLLLEKLAPHLVHAQPFLFPFYKGDARPPWFVGLGLWLYDLLALGTPMGRHRGLSRAKVLEMEPSLEHPDLLGAALYHDCRINDARLVLENVLDAERHGARCLNYAEVLGAETLQEGQVRLRVRDLEAEQEALVEGRLLVNAAGPWGDEVLGLLGRRPAAPVLKPTKGVHLVTRAPLTRDKALLAQVAGEKRIFFVIPFRQAGRECSLVGTTDTDFQGDKDHVACSAADLDYLLKGLQRLLPKAGLDASQIQASYAGLRPLAAPGSGAHNSAISREAQILESGGLLTLVGGKFTTYRHFAERAVDRAMRLLEAPPRPCLTGRQPLPGAPRDEAGRAWLGLGMGENGDYLRRHYGLFARAVLELGAEDPALMRPLAPGAKVPAILAQAAYAARHEHAARLQDFYLRRTFLGLELEPGHEGVEEAARAMGRELGWSRDRELEELEDLEKLVSSEFRQPIN